MSFSVSKHRNIIIVVDSISHTKQSCSVSYSDVEYAIDRWLLFVVAEILFSLMPDSFPVDLNEFRT